MAVHERARPAAQVHEAGRLPRGVDHRVVDGADGARFLMVHGDEQERPAREVRVILGFVR